MDETETHDAMTDALSTLEPLPPLGTDFTPEEKFYLDWGLDTIKSNISRLNDIQKTMATLSVSLLGGSLVFYGDAITTPVFKTLATIVLIFAALVSILGSMPSKYYLALDNPAQINTSKEKAS
jgi:hypothetical protein